MNRCVNGLRSSFRHSDGRSLDRRYRSGAGMLGKQVSLRRREIRTESVFPLVPDGFASLPRDVRAAHDPLGHLQDGQKLHEQANMSFHRSLRAVRPILTGIEISTDDVRSLKTGGVLHPHALHLVLGQRASRDLELGGAITWSDLQLGQKVE